jgi:hypothetical protein
MDRQQRRAGVVDDGRHLVRRQPPVDRDVHRTDERATEQEVEVRDPVPIEEGDPVTDAEAVAPGRLPDPTGHVELFGPGSALSPENQHLVVRLLARQVPQQTRHGVAALFGDRDAHVTSHLLAPTVPERDPTQRRNGRGGRLPGLRSGFAR